MSVKAIYDDNQSEVIKSGYSVTGYDKTKSGTQTITVTYRNQTATFDVTVAEPQITKIEITTTDNYGILCRTRFENRRHGCYRDIRGRINSNYYGLYT